MSSCPLVTDRIGSDRKQGVPVHVSPKVQSTTAIVAPGAGSTSGPRYNQDRIDWIQISWQRFLNQSSVHWCIAAIFYMQASACTMKHSQFDTHMLLNLTADAGRYTGKDPYITPLQIVK